MAHVYGGKEMLEANAEAQGRAKALAEATVEELTKARSSLQQESLRGCSLKEIEAELVKRADSH